VEQVSIARADDLRFELGDNASEQDVRAALAKIEVVREALKAADMFRDQSVKFAKYEAYALVRAYEITGDSTIIKGKWRRLAAEWLANMSIQERDKYIELCSDGKTIDNVYKELVALPEQRNAVAMTVEKCKKDAREQLLENGMVSVTNIVARHSDSIPRSMRRDITDGVRKYVMKAGGVGIGDSNGTYIDPDSNNRYVGDAVATRIDAVVRDIESIADLVKRCQSKPNFAIKGNGSSISFADVTYMILAGVGCASVSFDSSEAKRSAVAILRQVAGDI
jgi:hypothetical protein